MSGISDAKKNDIIEFIKLSYLGKEALETVLPEMIKNRLWNQPPGTVDLEMLIQKSIERLCTPAYLKPYIKICKEIFTHQEIIELLKIYKSDVWKKYSTLGSSFSDAILIPIMEVVNEITAFYCPIDTPHTLNFDSKKYGEKP